MITFFLGYIWLIITKAKSKKLIIVYLLSEPHYVLAHTCTRTGALLMNYFQIVHTLLLTVFLVWEADTSNSSYIFLAGEVSVPSESDLWHWASSVYWFLSYKLFPDLCNAAILFLNSYWASMHRFIYLKAKTQTTETEERTIMCIIPYIERKLE